MIKNWINCVLETSFFPGSVLACICLSNHSSNGIGSWQSFVSPRLHLQGQDWLPRLGYQGEWAEPLPQQTGGQESGWNGDSARDKGRDDSDDDDDDDGDDEEQQMYGIMAVWHPVSFFFLKNFRGSKLGYKLSSKKGQNSVGWAMRGSGERVRKWMGSEWRLRSDWPTE